MVAPRGSLNGRSLFPDAPSRSPRLPAGLLARNPSPATAAQGEVHESTGKDDCQHAGGDFRARPACPQTTRAVIQTEQESERSHVQAGCQCQRQVAAESAHESKIREPPVGLAETSP